MDVIKNNPNLCIEWLQWQLGLKIHEPHAAYGFADGGTILAAVVFSNCTGVDCHINLAGRTALSRAGLRFNALIPFEQMGCSRLTGLTKPDSEMDRLMLRLGFRSEGRIRRYYQDASDANVWGMLREECRWF